MSSIVALLVCCCTQATGLLVSPAIGSSVRHAAAASPAARVTEPTMMAKKKKLSKIIKLAIDAGKATPAPPIGPALGSAGVNIMMFCKEYNARTQEKIGTIIPVEISVYEDKSFTFILKTPPCSSLIKKAAAVPKGSGTPFGREQKVAGSITMEQVSEPRGQFVEQLSHRCTATGQGRPPPAPMRIALASSVARTRPSRSRLRRSPRSSFLT